MYTYNSPDNNIYNLSGDSFSVNKISPGVSLNVRSLQHNSSIN